MSISIRYNRIIVLRRNNFVFYNSILSAGDPDLLLDKMNSVSFWHTNCRFWFFNKSMKSYLHLLSVWGCAINLICPTYWSCVKEIGSGSASCFCFHLVDIPIRHKRLVFTILISVLTCSVHTIVGTCRCRLLWIEWHWGTWVKVCFGHCCCGIFRKSWSSQFWDAISARAANILAAIIIGPYFWC
jgi:hypothetical protein